MTDSEKAHWQEWLEESKGVLFKIRWFRIILDEAQYISHGNLTNVQLHQKSTCPWITRLWGINVCSEMVSHRYSHISERSNN